MCYLFLLIGSVLGALVSGIYHSRQYEYGGTLKIAHDVDGESYVFLTNKKLLHSTKKHAIVDIEHIRAR